MRSAGKAVRMIPATIAVVTRVLVRDPLLLLRLGHVLRLSGRCVERCDSRRLRTCMTRRLRVLQGYEPSRAQQELMLAAAAPLRKALKQP